MYIAGAVFLLVCSLAACSPLPSPPESLPRQDEAKIFGEVGGCFAQKVIFPLGNVEIYVFPVESEAELFKRLKEVPKSAETAEEIEILLQRRDEFIEIVRRRAAAAIRTKSNKQGQYSLTGLKPGGRYLLIGIVPPQEDTEEYFLYFVTHELKAERQRIDLWDGDIPRSECREAQS